MWDFGRLHSALFDELERQGVLIHGVDVARLTAAALAARAKVDKQPLPVAPNSPRCVNGACDE